VASSSPQKNTEEKQWDSRASLRLTQHKLETVYWIEARSFT